MTQPISRVLLALLTATLCACASTEADVLQEDPLPALFPVQIDYPRHVAGFELREDRGDAARRSWRYQMQGTAAQVEAVLWFPGAWPDGSTAIAAHWPEVVAAIDSDLAAGRFSDPRARSDRLRAVASGRADAPLSRSGRSLRLDVQTETGPAVQAHALYFVDPYLLWLRSAYPAAEAATLEPALDRFAEALVATLAPDPAVLCDPRIQVLKVRSGLSNVSSNGRVVFVSTETDHVDPSTVAELKRLAELRRQQVGCPAQDLDFSVVEAQLRRRARVR